MDLSILRRTAAEIAAAAVYELYPAVELWGGGETSTGFFYDLHFPHPVHAHLIEERMRQIIRERRPIRTLEMVAFSAGELLKKEGHLARAEQLPDGLVEVIQIGSFHDFSPGPHLKNTAELAAFKISIESLPDQGIRIVGWCHNSKEELKQFLKKLDSYIEPAELGERRGLCKGPIWLPEGIELRRRLIQFLKGQWFADAMEVSCFAEGDRTGMHRSLDQAKIGEIWTDPSSQTTQIQLSFFDQSEAELISSLHSIGKTLTILGFDHSTVSIGPETVYQVSDGLDRSEAIVQVKRTLRRGSSTQDMVVTAAVEKIFFLLLEKDLFLQMVDVENK